MVQLSVLASHRFETEPLAGSLLSRRGQLRAQLGLSADSQHGGRQLLVVSDGNQATMASTLEDLAGATLTIGRVPSSSSVAVGRFSEGPTPQITLS